MLHVFRGIANVTVISMLEAWDRVPVATYLNVGSLHRHMKVLDKQVWTRLLIPLYNDELVAAARRAPCASCEWILLSWSGSSRLDIIQDAHIGTLLNP